MHINSLLGHLPRTAVAGIALSFFVTFSASAKWDSVRIPGASCGDGSPYSIFLRQGSIDKWLLDFQVGGACWSFETCIGPTPMAWIHPMPFPIEPGGMLSREENLSPVANHTVVYFPYCTGDVHIGNHVAEYRGIKVYHMGRVNVERALEYLRDNHLIRFGLVKQVVVYGSSAGAISALSHIPTIDRWLPASVSDRVLIADSPGLHFGNRFWKKFSPQFLEDFRSILSRVGFSLKSDHGNVSEVLPLISRQYTAWRVGVLQTSRDIVMSRVFGEISQNDHEDLVYGNSGILSASSEPRNGFSAWIPSSASHALLATDLFAREKSSDGVSAMDFTRWVIEGRPQSTHR